MFAVCRYMVGRTAFHEVLRPFLKLVWYMCSRPILQGNRKSRYYMQSFPLVTTSQLVDGGQGANDSLMTLCQNKTKMWACTPNLLSLEGSWGGSLLVGGRCAVYQVPALPRFRCSQDSNTKRPTWLAQVLARCCSQSRNVLFCIQFRECFSEQFAL